MLFPLFMALGLASFVLSIWMLVRVFRGSVLLGIACLLIPGAMSAP